MFIVSDVTKLKVTFGKIKLEMLLKKK